MRHVARLRLQGACDDETPHSFLDSAPKTSKKVTMRAALKTRVEILLQRKDAPPLHEWEAAKELPTALKLGPVRR